MSIQELSFALYGDYISTGVYSFEFKKPSGGRITEIFFLIPPENISITESQRGSLTPTLKGGYWSDFGNNFKEINISGSSHFYYAGTPKGGTVNIDGYSEFMKLKFMTTGYRDYTLTENGKLKSPDIPQVKALFKHVKEHGGLATDINVLWHDFDGNAHFEVKIDELMIEQVSSDPFSINYSINMTGFLIDENMEFRKSPEIKRTVEQDIDSAIYKIISDEEMEELSYINNEIYLLNQKLIKAKENLETVRELIRKRQKSTSKILTEYSVN